MNCDELIRSEDTYDLIIPNEVLGKLTKKPECELPINDTYKIYYYNKDELPKLGIADYTYSAIPKCFGLLQTNALEESGIYRIQTQSTLSLTGQGVLVGFADSGIAYYNSCFRNSDGTTRIRAIWDQTVSPGAGQDQSVIYGAEYGMEKINEALFSEEPLEIVPQTDENGHGTGLSAIACGSRDIARGFVGAAPDSEILFVKLKPAKDYLKEFYYIPKEEAVYQENDIMAAVAWLEKRALELGKPLVICLALGTNNGSHSGISLLAEYLNEIGGLWNRCVVCASGNETGERHHFSGSIRETAASGEPVEVEINAAENMTGFYAEFWALAPELFRVGVRSPGGALFSQTDSRTGNHQEYHFTLEDTEVEIDYRTVGRTQGDQLIFIRFKRPVSGIWTILVYPDTTVTGKFNIWLPMKGMLKTDVFFLKPDPEVTLTIPSVAHAMISVGAYQTSDGGLYRDSGRGYTAKGEVKPTFLAPQAVQTIGIRGDIVSMTGTSAAAALTAGACAQFFEWGAVRRNDLALNSVEIANILIRGCRRDPALTYPNPAWGYGKLDIYTALAML